jgi:hypothetical protein
MSKDFEGFGAPDWDEARVEGGIHAFDDVLKPDRSKPQVGSELVPSPEGARKYARFVESMIEAQQLPEEDEDLIAAA